jgi:hypothetical protein
MKQAKLLPLRSAAKVLGIKPENLRREADSGNVPHTKIGDDYLFSLTALEKTLLVRAEGKVADAR